MPNIWDTIKRAEPTMRPNYLLIPVTDFDVNEEGARDFNDIYNHYKQLGYNTLKRTRSGGISKVGVRLPAWSVTSTSTSVELVIGDRDGWCRICFREAGNYEGDKRIFGRQAFTKFKEHLMKHGIDLSSYEEEDGYKYKEQIEAPFIRLEDPSYKDVIFDNVHHIDFHNSYPAGLVNTHPEFREAITELYEKRKENQVYKAILNMSIGFMQSMWCGYRLSKLSRDAIKDNNDRIRDLSRRLAESGRKILLYNTDGIFYQGEIYHGEGEGSKLGEWSNDHTDCRFRAKSDGAYEFIENGTYHPVIRGRTRLDAVKPRTQWEWGDIYVQSEIIKYRFTYEGGVTEYEEIQG